MMGTVGAVRVLLIPGFWLNAHSWEPIVEVLALAGHDVKALDLPGMKSKDDNRCDITLRDQVAAAVDELDQDEGGVVLVGHSAGGAIANAVADARPERVVRVVYVDSIPLGNGDCINDELPEVGGEIALPDWSVFSDEDLVDLSEELRRDFRDIAIPVPARVARDPQELHDPRRYDVPVTIIACEFSSVKMREWIAEGHPWMAELGAVKDVTFVDLPTGHWPQFTKPAQLTDVLLNTLG
jgi:pimeloyl-ACP methyl ester carboxylesterase